MPSRDQAAADSEWERKNLPVGQRFDHRQLWKTSAVPEFKSPRVVRLEKKEHEIVEHDEDDFDTQSPQPKAESLQALAPDSLVFKIREEMLQHLAAFDWIDIHGLSVAAKEYYRDLSAKRRRVFREKVTTRFRSTLDHVLIKYQQKEAGYSTTGVFASDINTIRLTAASLMDLRGRGSELNLSKLARDLLRQWMVRDGILKRADSTAGHHHATGQSVTAISSPLAGQLRKVGSHQSSNDQPSPFNSATTGGHDGGGGAVPAITLAAPAASPLSSPRPSSAAALARSSHPVPGEGQYSGSLRVADNATTHAEPSFWMSTQGGGGRASKSSGAGGGSGSGGGASALGGRTTEDGVHMNRIWAAERGVLSTIPAIAEGIDMALEQNELRMLDPAGAALAATVGRLETQDAYTASAGDRWHRRPVAGGDGQPEMVDALAGQVRLPGGELTSIRDAPGSSVEPPSSIASLSARAASIDLRAFMAKRHARMQRVLADAGLRKSDLDDASAPASNEEGGGDVDYARMGLITRPDNNAKGHLRALPVGSRIAVTEVAPGVVQRIHMPRPGVIAVTTDNAVARSPGDSDDVPPDDDRSGGYRGGRVDAIPYIPRAVRRDTSGGDDQYVVVDGTIGVGPASTAGFGGGDTAHTDDTASAPYSQSTASPTLSTSRPKSGKLQMSASRRNSSSSQQQSERTNIVHMVHVESSDFSSFASRQNYQPAKFHGAQGAQGRRTSRVGSSSSNTLSSTSSSGASAWGGTGTHVHVIAAPVYRQPGVVASLANAMRPLAAVDTVDIHAHARSGAATARPSPGGASHYEQQQQQLYQSATSRPSTPTDIKDSTAREGKWWHGQGYQPGTSLAPANRLSTNTILGPVLASRLRQQGIQDDVDLLLMRSGAASMTATLSASAASASAALMLARQSAAVDDDRHHRPDPVSPLHVSTAADASRHTLSMTDSMRSSTAGLSRHDDSLVSPTHASTGVLGSSRGGYDTLHPRVHESLSQLTSTLVSSQSLPLNPGSRKRTLGPVHSIRPLPFKLSPIKPHKPVSLKKRNGWAMGFVNP